MTTNTATIDWKDEVTDGFMTGTSSDGRTYREFIQPRNEFMRCQVGIVEWEQRETTPWSCTKLKSFETLPIFHLLGYGGTMEEAKKMANGVTL